MRVELEKIEDVVLDVLTRNVKARSDDFILYGSVLQKMGIDIKLSFIQLFKNHTFYNLPAFESVTRARRKIQSTRADLTSKKVKEQRSGLEKVYKDFAKK